MRACRVGTTIVGEGQPFALIAGPCVLESEAMVFELAGALQSLCAKYGVPFIFKASVDKANRTRGDSFRGLGFDTGLAILASLRRELGVLVTTDVHAPEQADAVAAVVDLLQIPAFLCRQTDLLEACGRTGLPVNVKKGQFVAPWDMRFAVDKLITAGASGVLLTERGTSFGHGDLVVDFRGLAQMQALGVPVCFDATHSTQRPGALAGSSGGQPEFAPLLGRAAVAAGVDLLFAEVHTDPPSAKSDAATQLRLSEFEAVLVQWSTLGHVVRQNLF